MNICYLFVVCPNGDTQTEPFEDKIWKLRKMQSHSSGVWDESLGVTITNSCSFSPGALPSHVCCPLSYCHLVFGIWFGCERKRQNPPISSLFCQPTNQPPFSWCSAKFKNSNLAVWFMQLRPGSDENNKVRCQRISCCCFWGVKTTENMLWGYLCSLWFLPYQWMVS